MNSESDILNPGYRERIAAATDMGEVQRLYDEAMQFHKTAHPRTVRAWYRTMSRRLKELMNPSRETEVK